ncbi:MAG: lytic transglycosylase, partial [Betaproteobacteria bacterium]
AWVAPRTLRTAEAAKLTGMDESRLREINRIPRGMMIRQGSALLVPRHGRHDQDVSERLADSGTLNLQREGAGKAKPKAGVTQNKPTAKPKSAAAKSGAPAASNAGPGQINRARVAAGSEGTVRR